MGMAQFLRTYLGQPQFSSLGEGKVHTGKWMKWVKGLGDTLVHPARPLPRSTPVGPNGVNDGCVPVSGFLIIEAANMDAAIAIAQADPFSAHADIGVSEMMVMDV